MPRGMRSRHKRGGPRLWVYSAETKVPLLQPDLEGNVRARNKTEAVRKVKREFLKEDIVVRRVLVHEYLDDEELPSDDIIE